MYFYPLPGVDVLMSYGEAGPLQEKQSYVYVWCTSSCLHILSLCDSEVHFALYGRKEEQI